VTFNPDAPQWVMDVAMARVRDPSQLPELARMLQDVCKKLPDSIIYEKGGVMAPRLAAWWDAHRTQKP